ncbi:MAG: sialate O-acetylesterase [Saprospiraceae bacterium]
MRFPIGFMAAMLHFPFLQAQHRLSFAPLFTDHMVLQRDKPIVVWGTAKPNATVQVRLDDEAIELLANEAGQWKATLEARPASGPFVLSIRAKNKLVQLNDVLVGDVWICAGQSNMEFTVKETLYDREVIEAAKYPSIRHIKINRGVSLFPTTTADCGVWTVCADQNAAAFSAAAYFFAKELVDRYHIPVGIINITWGGTQIESWISYEGMTQSDLFRGYADAFLKNAKPDHASAPRKTTAQTLPAEPVTPNVGTAIFNAMVNPVTGFPMRGVLWYQGESNVGRAFEYRFSFPLLIQDWRRAWACDFPFLFVQLANWEADGGNSNTGSTWAELRESQAMALQLPKTGMAVTIDIGETKDLHPKNKMDVGKRLAREAFRVAYGEPLKPPGASRPECIFLENKVFLTFPDNEQGLMVREPNGVLRGFELAGDDEVFYQAEAELTAQQVVVVHCAEAPQPVAVRYAWADDPAAANLVTTEGFPVAPFRSDNWPCCTAGEHFFGNK